MFKIFIIDPLDSNIRVSLLGLPFKKCPLSNLIYRPQNQIILYSFLNLQSLSVSRLGGVLACTPHYNYDCHRLQKDDTALVFWKSALACSCLATNENVQKLKPLDCVKCEFRLRYSCRFPKLITTLRDFGQFQHFASAYL